MGTPEEFRQMLGFVEAQGIRPVIAEVFPLDRAVEAMNALGHATHIGKIVIDHHAG